MKTAFLTLLSAFAILGFAPLSHAAATVGEKAPEFTGVDTNGTEHSLSDFEGKVVVLEWSNHECPYVVKHYDSGNMQKIQKEATDDGVVWLTVVSSAEGKQGYLTPEEANALMEEQGSNATARIMDPSGKIGKAYGAKTTPHMYVIDEEGMLVYAGAIDSDSTFKPENIEGATNYVQEALTALENDQPIEVASTKPYGCSVKY